MPDVCLYFQIHQPDRLRHYGVFDIGRHRDYFDQAQNAAIVAKVAGKCYRPALALLRQLIDRHEGRFRVAFSVSGVALDQLERWAPDVIESLRALAGSGCAEFLGETHFHSLACVGSPQEFEQQVLRHGRRLQGLLGVRPRVFRNTELILDDRVAEAAARLGFAGALGEGAERLLGGRSPNFVYRSERVAGLRLLLRNYRLSDDLAFRFGDPHWAERPLSPEKFAGWIHAVNGRGQLVNLFMDFETFGEHQWAETGIFEFLRGLPAAILSHAETGFVTPSQAIARHAPIAALAVPEPVSWADSERDLSAWLGNPMQREALDSLYGIREAVLAAGDPEAADAWRRLTTSDHLYYMCTKRCADGGVHRYFSPFESPYEAHIAFMNALSDLALRVGARPPIGIRVPAR